MGDQQRLDGVETKLAHQELLVSELSDIIYRQQQQIDRLERKQAELTLRLRELASRAESGPSEEQPPPHY